MHPYGTCIEYANDIMYTVIYEINETVLLHRLNKKVLIFPKLVTKHDYIQWTRKSPYDCFVMSSLIIIVISFINEVWLLT